MYDSLKIASLVASRLCHDLASPLGSVSNGLELLELTGATNGPEYDLSLQSAQSAIARLNIYRLAFGNANSGQVSLTALLTADISHVVRDGIVVNCNIDGPIDRAQAQSLLLSLFCFEKTLPQGGQITLSQNAHQYLISAQGVRFSTETPYWSCLQNGQEINDLQASLVEFALLPMTLNAQNLPFQISQSHNQLTLTITHGAVLPNRVNRAAFHHRRQDT
ncbi:hypothetical protein ROA7450_01577 [Roseovarius albus]|uniref:Histidine phosphotransferase ChpT C-terminal domain-containing protein n=1 Tax=Roseovarius albus TaxID=1247867 RepID=A0A1X6YYI9_9RHOB|nr:histidine phosphotransferase family protein [Roseovarius albus]SLN34615.1 hypothetical protein ROA7450_01577 [Roseovarius albus]